MVTVNGIFRPIALVEGRAVGVWGLAGGVVSLRPFAPLPDSTVAALGQDATDVLRYLDLPNRAEPLVVESDGAPNAERCPR